jgi:hypothetical protein
MERVDWPQSSINWILLGIHQKWIDKASAEQDHLEPLAIPDDPAAEKGSHRPPLV